MSSYYTDSDLQHQSKMVLCIEEYMDPSRGRTKGNIDSRIFIHYDQDDRMFYMYGRRQDKKVKGETFVPYFFSGKTVKSIYKFLRYVIDSKTEISITLYNYNDYIDKDFDEISYEYFDDNMDYHYEIVGYDKERPSHHVLHRVLNLVKTF